MKFTDTHCHLDFPELSEPDGKLESLLKACAEQHIKTIVVPTVSPKNWLSVIALTSTYSNINQKIPKLYSALGIHPWYVHDCTIEDIETLAELIKVQRSNKVSNVIAIGEAGIDLPIAEKYQNLSEQIRFFEEQVSLATEFNLPLIVHHRRSHNKIIEILKKLEFNQGGTIHAFSGSYQQAMQYVDMGFKLGIGGTITYTRAKKTINAIKRLPLSSLVLETDAPSMPLSNYQGEPNSPLRLKQIFDVLDEIRNEPTVELAEALEDNFKAALKPF